MAVGTVMRQPDRDPSRLAEKRTFRPLFARSVGIRPRLGATQRRLPHRPVGGQPGPVDPDHAVVLKQPLPPDLVEDAGLDPLLKAPVRRPTRSRSRSRQARSTASPSATPAGSRPSRPDPAPAADDSQADAPAAPATTARSAPTTSPASATHRHDHKTHDHLPRRMTRNPSPSGNGSLRPTGIGPNRQSQSARRLGREVIASRKGGAAVVVPAVGSTRR